MCSIYVAVSISFFFFRVTALRNPCVENKAGYTARQSRTVGQAPRNSEIPTYGPTRPDVEKKEINPLYLVPILRLMLLLLSHLSFCDEPRQPSPSFQNLLLGVTKILWKYFVTVRRIMFCLEKQLWPVFRKFALQWADNHQFILS